MITLAVDLSSPQGSVAVLKEEEVLAERVWQEPTRRPRGLFEMMPELLRRVARHAREIDLYAVGLGPGSFAGLRTSLMACRGMALPFGTPVYGMPSYEVVAADAASANRSWSRLIVLGDARRDHFWWVAFQREGDEVRRISECETAPWEQLPAKLQDPVWIVTPDKDRIRPRLLARVPAGASEVLGEIFPRASTLGRLALRRFRSKVPSWPLRPIYLHPPVGGMEAGHAEGRNLRASNPATA